MIEIDQGQTLRQDVLSVLIECQRERGASLLRQDLTPASINVLADELARRLAPRIGGRYVTKADERAMRDAAIIAMFNGRNHRQLMADFGISRALLYSILSRRRRPHRA